MLKRNVQGVSKKKKKGQSTLEYIVLVGAIIAAMLMFIPGTFKKRMEESYNVLTNDMVNFAGRISGARKTACELEPTKPGC